MKKGHISQNNEWILPQIKLSNLTCLYDCESNTTIFKKIVNGNVLYRTDEHIDSCDTILSPHPKFKIWLGVGGGGGYGHKISILGQRQ